MAWIQSLTAIRKSKENHLMKILEIWLKLQTEILASCFSYDNTRKDQSGTKHVGFIELKQYIYIKIHFQYIFRKCLSLNKRTENLHLDFYVEI